MAMSLLPLDSITKERGSNIEITAPTTLPPAHSKHIAHNQDSKQRPVEHFPTEQSVTLPIPTTVQTEEMHASPSVPSTQKPTNNYSELPLASEIENNHQQNLTSPYSLQLASSGDIVDVMECDIKPHDPTTIIDTTNIIITLP